MKQCLNKITNTNIVLATAILVFTFFVSQHMPFYVDQYHGQYCGIKDFEYRCVYMVLAFLSSVSVMSLTYKLYKVVAFNPSLLKSCTQIGKDTMLYYLCHMGVIFVIYRIISFFNIPKCELLHLPIVVIVMYVCYLLGKLKTIRKII